MLIGYMRVSTPSVRGADGKPDLEEATSRERQLFDLQHDALIKAGVGEESIYKDRASGKERAGKSHRPQLDACLKALRAGDVLIVWKLDRLGRSLRELIGIVEDLKGRRIGFKSLTESMVDTTTAQGEMLFGFFGLIAQYERALTVERVTAGLALARARGRVGGRKYKMTAAKLRLAQAAMGKPETTVSELCTELGISRVSLYRYVAPDGELRAAGRKLLDRQSRRLQVNADAVVAERNNGLS